MCPVPCALSPSWMGVWLTNQAGNGSQESGTASHSCYPLPRRTAALNPFCSESSVCERFTAVIHAKTVHSTGPITRSHAPFPVRRCLWRCGVWVGLAKGPSSCQCHFRSCLQLDWSSNSSSSCNSVVSAHDPRSAGPLYFQIACLPTHAYKGLRDAHSRVASPRTCLCSFHCNAVLRTPPHQLSIHLHLSSCPFFRSASVGPSPRPQSAANTVRIRLYGMYARIRPRPSHLAHQLMNPEPSPCSPNNLLC